jgi:bifunctional ADP-heptose synthase (sugar kinase/adenylyltransferase)
MSYFERDKRPLHLKTAAQDVFDVSAAGDTLVALAALGTAASCRSAKNDAPCQYRGRYRC